MSYWPAIPASSWYAEANIDWVTPVSRRMQGAAHTRAALEVAPDLDAVVASSDEAALGAVDALEARGLGNRLGARAMTVCPTVC